MLFLESSRYIIIPVMFLGFDKFPEGFTSPRVVHIWYFSLLWVHGNATEHMYEDVYAKIVSGEGKAYTNPNLYTQELMSDFYGSLEQATISGIKYGEIIPAGNWEFIFVHPRQEGLLPVIKHAQFNGW